LYGKAIKGKWISLQKIWQSEEMQNGNG